MYFSFPLSQGKTQKFRWKRSVWLYEVKLIWKPGIPGLSHSQYEWWFNHNTYFLFLSLVVFAVTMIGTRKLNQNGYPVKICRLIYTIHEVNIKYHEFVNNGENSNHWLASGKLYKVQSMSWSCVMFLRIIMPSNEVNIFLMKTFCFEYESPAVFFHCFHLFNSRHNC